EPGPPFAEPPHRCLTSGPAGRGPAQLPWMTGGAGVTAPVGGRARSPSGQVGNTVSPDRWPVTREAVNGSSSRTWNRLSSQAVTGAGHREAALQVVAGRAFVQQR